MNLLCVAATAGDMMKFFAAAAQRKSIPKDGTQMYI